MLYQRRTQATIQRRLAELERRAGGGAGDPLYLTYDQGCDLYLAPGGRPWAGPIPRFVKVYVVGCSPDMWDEDEFDPDWA